MKDQPLRLARVRQLTATGEARRLRLRARLSLGDIARSIGVERTTVLRWERGERQPRGSAALEYGDLLDRLAHELEDTR